MNRKLFNSPEPFERQLVLRLVASFAVLENERLRVARVGKLLAQRFAERAFVAVPLVLVLYHSRFERNATAARARRRPGNLRLS